MKNSREERKRKDKDGNIIQCSNWLDGKYCARCPDRLGCDVLGKLHFKNDFWNPSSRQEIDS